MLHTYYEKTKFKIFIFNFFLSFFQQTLDNEPLIRALSTQLEGRLRRILSFEEPFSILPKHLSLHILGFLDPCTHDLGTCAVNSAHPF